jgi:hypothetical protein
MKRNAFIMRSQNLEISLSATVAGRIQTTRGNDAPFFALLFN